jgi:hypothetical protein
MSESDSSSSADEADQQEEAKIEARITNEFEEGGFQCRIVIPGLKLKVHLHVRFQRPISH